MDIRIEDLLINLKFGPLEVGAKKEIAILELGQPDSDNDMGNSGSILLYGWYELYFDPDGILYAVQNDSYRSSDRNSYLFKNHKFRIDPWFMDGTPNQGIAEITAILDSKDLEYQIAEYYGRNIIKLNSGAIIDFNEKDNSNGVNELIGVRYFAW